MGNNSTAADPASLTASILLLTNYINSSSNSSSNYSSIYSSSLGSGGFSFFFMTWTDVSVTDMLNHCVVDSGIAVYLTLKIVILLTAFPANIVLAWLLFKSRRNLSPSQLLALNISILDILYCLVLPLDIHATLYDTSETIHELRESLSSLNIFGCPLLLTFMCLERYIAAAFPITFLQLSKWKYRIMLCVLAWILILCMTVLFYFYQELRLMLAMVVVIIILFLQMLVCLVGIVWELRQDGPGDGARSPDSLKKRALNNILMVIVPAVIAYTPLVIAVGFIAVIISSGSQSSTPEQCNALLFLFAFPNFGLYIGPLFYLSRIRQIICCKQSMENTVSKTQAE